MLTRVFREEAAAKAKRDETPVGPRLRIGRADDRAERDADRFAARLWSAPMPAPMEPATSKIQRRAVGRTADPLGGTAVPSDLSRRIRSIGGGTQLPTELRARAEQQSGHDLGRVRVHAGVEADTLSRSVDALAFTTGSDIFLSRDVPRRGKAARDDVLAHEVGHVVQQSAGQPHVARLLGKKKAKHNPAALADNRAVIDDRKKLAKEIGALESALQKLHKAEASKNKRSAAGKAPSKSPAPDRSTVSWEIVQAAHARLSNMPGAPGQNGKGGQQLGIAFTDERRRLQRVLDEANVIFDEHRVALTKQAAQDIYVQAGKGAADPTAAGPVKPLQMLNLKGGFTPSSDRHHEIHAAGKAFGLSPAEIAAIATFTSSDYNYINPAASNDDGWMKAVYDTEDDATRSARKEEGSLHTAMAVSGLGKLPVWRGDTFRGESKSLADFNRDFEVVMRDGTARPLALTETDGMMRAIEVRNLFDQQGATIRIKQSTFTQKPLVSTSRNRSAAAGFGSKSDARPLKYMYSFTLKNGRDVQGLSVISAEAEVITLPGATFRYDSITYNVRAACFEVHCTQIR